MGAFTVDEFNQLPNASELGATDSGIECTRFTMVNQVPVFNVFATSSRALQSLKVSNSTISDEFLFLVANVSLPLNRLSHYLVSLCFYCAPTWRVLNVYSCEALTEAADSALSDKGLAIIGSRCSRLLKLDLENCEAKGIQAIVRISTTLRDKLEKVSSSQERISISYSAFILITEMAK
ncbi:hypothetical protein P3S68_006175 [Capsicum galapagoense]